MENIFKCLLVIIDVWLITICDNKVLKTMGVISIILLGISLLMGCEPTPEMVDYQGKSTYFRVISEEVDGKIVYDTRTGVEYWESWASYTYGNLTVLVDEDGKPLIFKGE